MTQQKRSYKGRSRYSSSS